MTDKEKLRRLKKDYKRLHGACFKIMDIYAKAPGWANPTPTTDLVWKMYQTALKAVAPAIPPEQC